MFYVRREPIFFLSYTNATVTGRNVMAGTRMSGGHMGGEGV
jgi:hypothetical protein